MIEVVAHTFRTKKPHSGGSLTCAASQRITDCKWARLCMLLVSYAHSITYVCGHYAFMFGSRVTHTLSMNPIIRYSLQLELISDSYAIESIHMKYHSFSVLKLMFS